jgi:hypothetical protein
LSPSESVAWISYNIRRTAFTIASKPLVISAFSESAPSRNFERTLSPVCATFSNRENPRNPQLPFIV